MGRPHIEFIQSQSLPWAPPQPGQGYPQTTWKVLSRDRDSGEVTALVQFPAGWRSDQSAFACATELFVLRGEISLNGVDYGLHDYAFLPAGYPQPGHAGAGGAVLMVFFHGAPGMAAPGGFDESALIRRTVTRLVPWDNSNVDPNINHLHAHRKNLRLDPAGTCRTYLLGGLPHGFSPTGTARKESHPHVEEFFMVSGGMACTMVGHMRHGAYFWRPPGLLHGLDSSLTGFLLLCRTPGSNKTISAWDDARLQVNDNPPYNPILPPELAALNPRDLPDSLVY